MIEWIQNNEAAASLIFSAVVALSTVVYAVLTALLVFETRRMRRAQTDPKLVAHVEPREEFVNFGHLYVRNIGLGPAFNVSFDLKPKSSGKGAQMLIDDFCKSRFLLTGLEYLGPGQHLQSNYTAFNRDYQDKIKAILEVTIKYRNAVGQKFTDICTIDISEFEGRGGLGKPHLYSIAQSLEKLEKDISSLTTGFRKLKVDSYDHEDRERDHKEWEKMHEEIQQKSTTTKPNV